MKKKILCLTLGLILTFSQVMSVSASGRKQQLQEEKAAAQSQLSAENSKINNLEEKKNTLLAEIDQLDQESGKCFSSDRCSGRRTCNQRNRDCKDSGRSEGCGSEQR